MIRKMRQTLARATTDLFVEHAIVAAAMIVALTNLLLVFITRGW